MTAVFDLQQSVAYECAREAYTELIGLHMEAIYTEESKLVPNLQVIARENETVDRLAMEQRQLRAVEKDRIATLRRELSAEILRLRQQRTHLHRRAA